ncbi:MAG TPA: TIGR03790 family protein, partial [Verrucomicrobiota bacterium]|nr:TIGR03790 family protein [Verrucomicrobiota bacterium]
MKPMRLCVAMFGKVWAKVDPTRGMIGRVGGGLLGLAIQSIQAQTPTAEAASVAVLFNSKESRSREVAEFYVRQRGIPETNLIGLGCESTEILTREQYERQVVVPLREQLEAKGLAHFIPEPAPAHPRPGVAAHRLMRSSIRYVVLAYGMPYRVAHEPNLGEVVPDSVPPLLRNNGASVDAELTVFPSGGLFPVTGPANNPFQGATNAALLQPDARDGGVFLVSRLDGPTPELAMGLVTLAMQADRDGL